MIGQICGAFPYKIYWYEMLAIPHNFFFDRLKRLLVVQILEVTVYQENAEHIRLITFENAEHIRLITFEPGLEVIRGREP